MRSTKSKGTGPELAVRRALWASGLRGYRVNLQNLPGKPDIVFTRQRVAVLVHGCFWHGCQQCSNYRLPKSNSVFWEQKLKENKRRDDRTESALSQLHFTVVIVWECEVEREMSTVIGKVKAAIEQSKPG